MALYQHIRLSDHDFIGEPGRPHYAVDGWSDDDLRDLDGTDERFGLLGTAFWPVAVSEPAYDPATETLTDAVMDRVVEVEAFRVTGVRGKRTLTADEIAVANPVPVEISDRQFAQVLALSGVITEAEAVAWAARGELPPALDNAIPQLPAEAQFTARMLLSAATLYERAHPLVPVFGEIMGMDSDALDDLWRRGSVL